MGSLSYDHAELPVAGGVVVRIKIRVIPNAKKCGIMPQPDGSLKVKVVAVPEKGKANRELVELLADHFNVKRSSVKIIAGERGRDKTIEITRP